MMEKNRKRGFDMRNNKKTKIANLFLVLSLILGVMMSTVVTAPKVQAAEKPYGKRLKLNNNIKFNKTKTFVKTGIYQEQTLFPKVQKCKIKYTISCKKRSVGKNYKVTYKGKYNLMDNPKLNTKEKYTYIDWYWGFTYPYLFYTVFDYQTGMSLEVKNDLNVKCKGSKWKYTYYPKQYFMYTDSIMKDEKYKEKNCWYRNAKTLSYSFTVTYPKKCKDVVVGIGFSNMIDVPSQSKEEPENQYWTGKDTPYGKTDYYKKGKKTMSYMRLR